MSIQVTLQRERVMHVSVENGVAVIDRWHLAIGQANRRAPLMLVRQNLLEAYNVARELCRANGWPSDWRPTILPAVVVTTTDAAGVSARQLRKHAAHVQETAPALRVVHGKRA